MFGRVQRSIVCSCSVCGVPLRSNQNLSLKPTVSMTSVSLPSQRPIEMAEPRRIELRRMLAAVHEDLAEAVDVPLVNDEQVRRRVAARDSPARSGTDTASMRGTPIGMHHRCGSSVSCCARISISLTDAGSSGSVSPFGSPCAMSFTGPRADPQAVEARRVPSGSRGAGLVADRRPLHFLAERADACPSDRDGSAACALQREIQP